MANVSSTSAINVNVDSQVKKEASSILKDLGLNMSTFINMALVQVVKRNGVPFEIANPRPSKELSEALREGEDILSGKVNAKRYTDMYEMLKDLKK